MNETIEYCILNDEYLPTELEIKTMARKLWDLQHKPDNSLTIELLHKQLEPVIFHDLECLDLKKSKDNKYHYDLLTGNLKDLFNGVNKPSLPNYEKAYCLLMEYWDSLPEEAKEGLSIQLAKLGC